MKKLLKSIILTSIVVSVASMAMVDTASAGSLRDRLKKKYKIVKHVVKDIDRASYHRSTRGPRQVRRGNRAQRPVRHGRTRVVYVRPYYDQYGYNRYGYNRYGYTRRGFHRNGYYSWRHDRTRRYARF